MGAGRGAFDETEGKSASMKVVYIAGPYTAPTSWKREQNIRAAESQSMKLWRAGVAAVCVHTNARYFYGEVPESTAIAIDDAILLRCDGLLLVPGWQESPGTLRELEIAKSRGIRVFYPSQVQDCIDWAEGPNA
jgi:hypothetical protein